MAMSLIKSPGLDLSYNPQTGSRNRISIAGKKDNFDEITDDEITDPKLQLQKRLIDALFNQNDEAEKSKKSDNTGDIQPDSVTISHKAFELYNQQSASLSIETPEGKIDVQYNQVTYMKISQTEQQAPVEQAEPLVFDLNNNGIELTDVRAGEGVMFDITGDGVPEQVSWVAPDDGMLVLDRNGNNSIDSGNELFGDQHGAANGFEELAKFDSDQNGFIERNDQVFQSLNIWQDKNQNGFSEAEELKSLASYGITRINLQPDSQVETIAGNRVEGYATYSGSGRSGQVGEVYLNYIA